MPSSADHLLATASQVDPIVPPSRFPAEYKRIADANFTVSLQGFCLPARRPCLPLSIRS